MGQKWGNMPWAEQLSSGLWRACWRDQAGRKRSRSGIKTKAAAVRYAGSQETAARRGDPTEAGRSPTWGSWRDQWLAARVVEPGTMHGDRGRVRRYLTPEWGGQRLNRITRVQVQAWVNRLAAEPSSREDDATISAATVDRIYRLFSASMKAAHAAGLIATNPCQHIDLPTVAPGHERFLTRGEFDMIRYFLNEPYRAMVDLLLWSGMRYGEAAGLHWQRVDLVNRQIDIVETWDPVGGRIKAYPKGKARRSVPISADLAEVLDAQWDRTGTAGSCGLHHQGGARCRSGLVIVAPKGGALDGHNFGKRDWRAAVELVGVGPTRLHDLRHTYASWLAQGGVPLQEIQTLLGHASITTTQRYAHLGASQRANVLAALEGR